jgi:hypothetical protein
MSSVEPPTGGLTGPQVLHASAECEVAILDGDSRHFAPVHVDATRAATNDAPSLIGNGPEDFEQAAHRHPLS